MTTRVVSGHSEGAHTGPVLPALLQVRGAINGAGYALGGPTFADDSDTLFHAEHVDIPDGCFIRLFPEIGAGSDAALHIESGARLALPLRHRGVVRVLDFSVTGQQPVFVAMEPFGGRSLDQVMAEDGIFPLPVAIAVVDDIADALQAAHTMGIVHGDLHPAAIRLTDVTGGRFATKILGFGWAKEFRATSGDRRHAIYLAPEQQQVSEGIALSESADQFSLAAIAYEMLAGCSYLSEESSDLADPEARRFRQPPRIAEMVLGLPAGLDDVLRRALSFAPVDRFNDIGEFAEALRQFSGGRGGARGEVGFSSTGADQPDADGTDLESLEAAATAFDDRRRQATLDPLTLPPLIYAATFPGVEAATSFPGVSMGKAKPSTRAQILFLTAGAAVVIAAVALMSANMGGTGTKVAPATPRREEGVTTKKATPAALEPDRPMAQDAPVPGSGERAASRASAAPVAVPAGPTATASPKIRGERKRRHHAHARRGGSHAASGRRASAE